MGPFTKLLQDTFSYQSQQPVEPVPVEPVVPVPVEPEKKTYNTRDSVIRDIDPQTATAVQAILWGGAGAPPQGGPGAPTGLAQDMSQPNGWGKTSG